MIENYSRSKGTNIKLTQKKNNSTKFQKNIIIKTRFHDKNKIIKKAKIKKFNKIKINENKDTIFSKYSLGKIKYAEMHKLATRPLKQIKELTDEEIKNNSCPCCGLIIPIEGKLEPYNLCDNPDEFCDYGEGIALFYSFFKFVIFITFVSSIGISIFNSYFAYNCNYELTIVCNNIIENYDKISNDSFNDLYEICKYYYTKGNKDYNITNEINQLYHSFFFKLSSENVNDYKTLYYKLNNMSNLGNLSHFNSELYENNNNDNKDFDSTLVNLDFTYILCSIIILFLNATYIFFLNNKSNAINYLNYNVSDYTILLTNLDNIYQIFDKNLEKIKKKEIKCSENNEKLDKNIYIDKLGFEPDEDIPRLD